jgi:hypothetical protein
MSEKKKSSRKSQGSGRVTIFFKTKFIFSFEMLGRISTIIEIIVNCIVCEREIGI